MGSEAILRKDYNKVFQNRSSWSNHSKIQAPFGKQLLNTCENMNPKPIPNKASFVTLQKPFNLHKVILTRPKNIPQSWALQYIFFKNKTFSCVPATDSTGKAQSSTPESLPVSTKCLLDGHSCFYTGILHT